MKKIVSLLLSLVLLLSCAVLAEEEIPANRILAVDSAFLNLADMNPQFKGTESTIRGCLGLQPAIEGQPEWTDYVDATVTVELVEGVNTLVLLNVEGFDNSVYKAINVDYIEWNPAAEIPAEVPAE